MSDFARLQHDFQQAVLTGDDTIIADILDSPTEKREVLLGVYRYAYGSRLVDALRNDHPLLLAYLGDEMFDAAGYAYVAANPSHHPNIRWFSQMLPEFLQSTEPYSEHPVLFELASLEKLLNDAFDATDAPALQVEDLAAVSPERWNDLRFHPHPSVRRCSFSTNAAAIWLALKTEETPPDVAVSGQPDHILVWRQDVSPMFRQLGDEEAMMWDAAVAGAPFGTLCAMLATHHDPDSAAARGASYLRGWVTSDLFTSTSQHA